jgi:hypothetical protein
VAYEGPFWARSSRSNADRTASDIYVMQPFFIEQKFLKEHLLYEDTVNSVRYV